MIKRIDYHHCRTDCFWFHINCFICLFAHYCLIYISFLRSLVRMQNLRSCWKIHFHSKIFVNYFYIDLLFGSWCRMKLERWRCFKKVFEKILNWYQYNWALDLPRYFQSGNFYHLGRIFNSIYYCFYNFLNHQNPQHLFQGLEVVANWNYHLK